MNTEQLHRDLGRLEGQVTALQAKVDGIDAKLDTVLKRQYKFAGGAAVVSAIGSFLVAWFLK